MPVIQSVSSHAIDLFSMRDQLLNEASSINASLRSP